jgi:hypothetical protein
MHRDLDQEVSAVSYFWESGRFVLHQWRDESPDVLKDCMIFDLRDRLLVRIEDNDFSYALKKRMLGRGVPLVRELPPDAIVLEHVLEVLASTGMDTDEINDAFDELKTMHESHMSSEAIEKRLAETKNGFSCGPEKGVGSRLYTIILFENLFL